MTNSTSGGKYMTTTSDTTKLVVQAIASITTAPFTTTTSSTTIMTYNDYLFVPLCAIPRSVVVRGGTSELAPCCRRRRFCAARSR